MEQVKALQGFDHNGPVRRGALIWVTPRTARDLARAGLVKRLRTDEPAADPSSAAGTPSSASPAAPASPQTTASVSDDGAPKRKRAKPITARIPAQSDEPSLL